MGSSSQAETLNPSEEKSDEEKNDGKDDALPYYDIYGPDVCSCFSLRCIIYLFLEEFVGFFHEY